MTLRLARSLALVALTLALPLAVPAQAQDMPTVLPNNYVLSDILNKQRVDSAINSGRGGGGYERGHADPFGTSGEEEQACYVEIDGAQGSAQ